MLLYEKRSKQAPKQMLSQWHILARNIDANCQLIIPDVVMHVVCETASKFGNASDVVLIVASDALQRSTQWPAETLAFIQRKALITFCRARVDNSTEPLESVLQRLQPLHTVIENPLFTAAAQDDTFQFLTLCNVVPDKSHQMRNTCSIMSMIKKKAALRFLLDKDCRHGAELIRAANARIDLAGLGCTIGDLIRRSLQLDSICNPMFISIHEAHRPLKLM